MAWGDGRAAECYRKGSPTMNEERENGLRASRCSAPNVVIRQCDKCKAEGKDGDGFSYCRNEIWSCW